MTTLGYWAKQGCYWGNSLGSREFALLVSIPASGYITHLDAWIEVGSDYPALKMVLWDSGGNVVAQSAQFYGPAAGYGAAHLGANLTAPYHVNVGEYYYIGWWGYAPSAAANIAWVKCSGSSYVKAASSPKALSSVATINYDLNVSATLNVGSPPNAPTCTTSGKQNSQYPVVSATVTDPNSATINKIRTQISFDAFAQVYEDSTETVSIASGGTASHTCGNVQYLGATYWYRMMASNDGGITWSSWGSGSYYTDSAPSAPTLITSGNLAGVRPPLSFSVTDPNSDNIGSYRIQITRPTDTGYAACVLDATVTAGGPWASGSTITYTPTADLTRDLTGYIYRVAAADTWFWGAWSSNGSFTCNSLPIATGLSPTGNAPCYIWNLGAEALWSAAEAHARFYWTFGDANGGSQGSYRVRVYTAANKVGGSVEDSGWITSAAQQYDSAYGLTNGTEYWWTVEVKDALGESSGESATQGFHCRWGQAIYECDPTGGVDSAQWSFTSGSVAANTQAAFVFASATGANGAGRGAWHAAIADVTPGVYCNILVRLSTNASGTQPALPNMTFTAVLPGEGIAISADTKITSPATGQVAVNGVLIPILADHYVLEWGWLAPTALSGSVNDWAPTGIKAGSVISIDATDNYSITGMLAFATGGFGTGTLMLWNNSAHKITLPNGSTSSAEANRWLCPNGVDYVIMPGASVVVTKRQDWNGWVVVGPIINAKIINPAITADQNDWGPAGFATADIFDCVPNANRSLTGLSSAGRVYGQRVTIRNSSGYTLTLKNWNASSASANRFSCHGSTDVVLSAWGSVDMFYGPNNGSPSWSIITP